MKKYSHAALTLFLASLFAFPASATDSSERLSVSYQFSECSAIEVQTNKVNLSDLNGSSYEGLQVCTTQIPLPRLDSIEYSNGIKASCKGNYRDTECVEVKCSFPSADYETRNNVTVYHGAEIKDKAALAKFLRIAKNFPACKSGGLVSNKTPKQSVASERVSDNTRQLCEAQKKTCIAGCGNPSRWNGSRWVDNQNWSECNYTCKSIDCN